ncbi:MAG: lipocalin family protein, partial [Proteobacteria bacterium]|nr:lipocalin family protein [Pseudomonadota bacterium]
MLCLTDASKALRARLNSVGLTLFVVGSLTSFILGNAGARAESLPPLETVDHVELQRYAGEWFEIASFPKWFNRGCVNTKATYELRGDGRVNVVNECRKFSADGRLSVAKGIARAVDQQTNSKLKVRFGWSPFEGDYWIIELGSDYEFAVISEPSRESLWI